jgi:hypothetical protein
MPFKFISANNFDTALTGLAISNFYIYIDGQYDNSKLATAIGALDSTNTPFTVGSSCNYSNFNPACEHGFCGYIDDVRLWTVPRNQRDIRNYMYSDPASDSPALALAVGFDIPKPSSLGKPVAVTSHDNCQVVLTNRKLPQNGSLMLRPLTAVEVSGTHLNPESQQIGEETLASTLGSTRVALGELELDSAAKDIWIKSIVRMLTSLSMPLDLMSTKKRHLGICE